MPSPSTVGRGKKVTLYDPGSRISHTDNRVSLHLGDALDFYDRWATPTAIISDGAYGILGFEGDTSSSQGLVDWYEPHVQWWSKRATPNTTLWFWNSEIGWAATHDLLERYGWRYINANIWDKGIGHVAGNVNTQKIRRFPVVTEVCVQYVFEASVRGTPLKRWLRDEWVRAGLALKRANEACGVKDAAVRKYLDQGHLWYMPPTEAMMKLSAYANYYGDDLGKPYYSLDRIKPVTEAQWTRMRAKFQCPHGVTNCWHRPTLRGIERVKIEGKPIHLNQKPLDLMALIINASTDVKDVVWEPFGGLFSGCLAAAQLGRKGLGTEIDPTYFEFGCRRCESELSRLPL
jgi:DNA modification methylase